LQFIHVPDGETESDPNTNEDSEIVNENVELSLVIEVFIIGLLILGLVNVVLSQEGADHVVGNPTDRKGGESILNNPSTGKAISDSVENGVPQSTVDASNKDHRRSGLLGEDVVSDLPDGVEGVVGPSVFLVVDVVDGSVVHGQGEDEEEEQNTNGEPETVVDIHSDLEVASVAKVLSRLVASSVREESGVPAIAIWSSRSRDKSIVVSDVTSESVEFAGVNKPLDSITVGEGLGTIVGVEVQEDILGELAFDGFRDFTKLKIPG